LPFATSWSGKSVLRESLTDGVKHALAAQIQVWDPADKQHIDFTDTDNRSALEEARAERLATSIDGHRDCGQLDVGDSPEGGLRLRWSIPIRQ
jgi:hypothetical protein